jgi:hypothetical protein
MSVVVIVVLLRSVTVIDGLCEIVGVVLLRSATVVEVALFVIIVFLFESAAMVELVSSVVVVVLLAFGSVAVGLSKHRKKNFRRRRCGNRSLE